MDLLFLPLFPLWIGVLFMANKSLEQRDMDHHRKTFRLLFPREMDEEQVAEWLDAISGTLHPRFFHLGASPAIVLELSDKRQGNTHSKKVPWEHAKFVQRQLEKHVPGIRVLEEQTHPAHGWNHMVEVGIAHTDRLLRIRSAESMSTTILSAVESLHEGQTVLMQWVLTPAVPTEQPIYHRSKSHNMSLLGAIPTADKNEVDERRKKLAENNMLAVLRVAARADTRQSAEHLVDEVRKAVTSARGAKTYFVKRMLSQDALNRRIESAATPFKFPMRLSVAELTSIMGWPIGAPHIIGLPRPLGRQYPPSGNLPREGIIIGKSSYPGSERPLAIGYDEGMMHTSVIGQTGVGKTALLANMAKQIMAAGHGLIVMETEGNLYDAVLNYVPENRVDEVVALDFSDNQSPVGLNVLDQGKPTIIIDEIINLFAHRYGVGLWSDEFILNGLKTLVEVGGLTLLDLGVLVRPRADEVAWVDSIIRKVKDPELKRWWQSHENRGRYDQQQRTEPVYSRITQMTSRPELRYVFGQSKSSFQIRDVLERNKILLVNLKDVSDHTKSLAATIIMDIIWYTAKSIFKPRPTFLILDEFSEYMDLPVNTQSMLAQARKFNLGFILAAQHMSQLKAEVKDGVVTNARNKVLFTCNRDDANLYAREIGKPVEPEDIIGLQAYEAIVSLMVGKDSSGPVSIKTYAPAQPTGMKNTVIDRSRRLYGRPIEDVQLEMERRHRVADTNKKKPPRTGQGWGA